jgi:hypothetical protein
MAGHPPPGAISDYYFYYQYVTDQFYTRKAHGYPAAIDTGGSKGRVC